ncbi:MAG: hypothetical protein OEZ34_00985 [Spirochaetia bacterium]|nr:hypothetical protein [Spirochaetia bacterium]
MISERNVIQEKKEDLREFFITPAYLEAMKSRSRKWDSSLIREQIQLFRKTISDYPEVIEILENELYRRELEALRKEIQKKRENEIQRLYMDYDKDSDFAEIIRIELANRKLR